MKSNELINNLVKIGLLVGALMVMLAIMPRADHQSYSYELNQPWKYPLLTAEFDMPIMRDSTTVEEMCDSINTHFIPFVKRNETVAEDSETILVKALSDSLPRKDVALLKDLLAEVYSKGIMEAGLGEAVEKKNATVVRTADATDSTLVYSKDVSSMLTAGDAYEYIDSAYNASKDTIQGALPSYVARSVYASINANVLLDTAMDRKFRTQELEAARAALGVIQQGQRIVDKGEIIDLQTFTNLNTYMKMLAEKEDSELNQNYYTIGQGIIILLLLVCLYFFLWHYRRTFYESVRQMTFLITFITLFVVFAVEMFEYVPNGLTFVPFAMVPVVIMIFFDSRTAIISLIITVLICSLVATFPFQFIMMEFLAGIAATMSITQLTKRSQLVTTAVVTLVVYSIVYVAMLLVTAGNLDGLEYKFFGFFAINAVVLSFAYILIVVMEKVFGFTSNVTLVELSDINNKLLRRLAEEAPGTFQHSVQVSNLAAEAARAIGANTLLVRTGSLYHDIGKLDSPVYFTENQHGVNPHNELQPEQSAKKIISHISYGLALARTYKLPKEIKDFIKQHHGRGVAKYFYTTAVNRQGIENVNLGDFQYPGPNPLSKETAILMMADAVEAASRSLKDYSPESISNLVTKIIDGQLADGMFNDAPISLKDIQVVKKTFINRLGTIYHTRIAYPDMKKP